MRILPLDRVKPGSVLARHVYRGEAFLLKAGARLTERLLVQLQNCGVGTLYVSEPEEENACTEWQPDLVGERTREEAARVLRKFLDHTRLGALPSSQPVSEAVSLILDEVLSHRAVLLELGEIRTTEGYLFGHSVQVSAIAAFLGIHLGLDQRELKALAVGAILHDVGKARVPRSIWEKPGFLSPHEVEKMRQHAVLGFEIIRSYRELDLRSAHVAYQHHERWDGQGYPRRLSGDQIHRFARIVAVADVFDALITDRPYRRAWMRHQAIQYIADQAGAIFDPDVVRTFLARVAPYPAGSMVRLNTGETARVLRLNARFPARPVIRIVASGEELDLQQALDRRIVGPVDETSSGAGVPGDVLAQRGEY